MGGGVIAATEPRGARARPGDRDRAAGILVGLSVRRGRVILAVPILATICVLGYAVAWFAMSGKP